MKRRQFLAIAAGVAAWVSANSTDAADAAAQAPTTPPPPAGETPDDGFYLPAQRPPGLAAPPDTAVPPLSVQSPPTPD
jgi:hypothetical protein